MYRGSGGGGGAVAVAWGGGGLWWALCVGRARVEDTKGRMCPPSSLRVASNSCCLGGNY